MQRAVDGSVVKAENTGGVTNWVSCAYGPMAKMEWGPRGEYVWTEREARDSNPEGECVADGGSDWRKDAGEDGGAMKGRTMAVDWV